MPIRIVPDSPPAECTCGQIECVCAFVEGHTDTACAFRQAVLSPTGIECLHGWDVCPLCDPCTCPKKAKADESP